MARGSFGAPRHRAPIWICSWPKSFHHSEFQFVLAFRRAFRISFSRERATIDWFWFPIFCTNWDIGDDHKLFVFSPAGTVNDLFALITGNSSLEPLLEGLLSQIHMDLSFQGFSRNQTKINDQAVPGKDEILWYKLLLYAKKCRMYTVCSGIVLASTEVVHRPKL